MTLQCTSARERRLWRMAGSYVLVIYSTLYLTPFITDFLRARNLLRVSVWVCLAAAAAWVVTVVWRQRPTHAELVVLAAAAILSARFVACLPIPEERLHLPEYGVLGGLIYFALRERYRRRASLRSAWRTWLPAALAILLAATCGGLDETIQAMLPNRVGSLRDAALNFEVAVVVVGAFAARDWVRGVAGRSSDL
jgi:hypothetical protein